MKDAATSLEDTGVEDNDGWPGNRSICRYGPRPCPWVRCRYHLYGEVTRSRKNYRPNFRLRLNTDDPPIYEDLDLWTLEETCALDVADRGQHTLEEVGAFLGFTRERARQEEVKALNAFHAHAARLGADAVREG